MKTEKPASDWYGGELEIYLKLHEAEREEESTEVRYSSADVLMAMRNAIK